MVPKGNSGFVYVIRDNVLKRFYLGKKYYWTRPRNTFKTVESDWKTYKSSSDTMKMIFDNRPFHEFDFICVEQYKMRGAVSYAETWSLCLVEAPTTKTWYNVRVEEVTWPVSENITIRHKERLERIIAMDAFENE